MHTIRNLLALAMFILSNLGYWEYLRRHLKADSCFFPSITIAFQTSVLFLAGILNMLPEASYLLYFFGIAYCLYSFIKRKGEDFFTFYLNPAYIVLAACFCISAIYLQGQYFLNYDNFSHWALVVKQMLISDRFPSVSDYLIYFQRYPLGSSVYVYYFAKLTSNAESMQMLGQCFSMLCALMPCFAFCKKKGITSAIIMLLFTAFVLTYNIEITELLVDTLLPLIGGAAFVFTFSQLHGFRSGDADTAQCIKSLWVISFFLIQLIQIKNSGLFFAVMISIAAIYYVLPRRKIIGAASLIPLALPYFSFLVWHKHCKYVFPSSAASKHAMTAANFANTFSTKTKEEMAAICKGMVEYSVSSHSVIIAAVFVMAVCIALFVLLYFKNELNSERRKLILHTALFCLLVYIIYQFGMLLMYLFSMPNGEANRLASVERYCRTILIFIYYISVTMALGFISLSKDSKGRSIGSYLISVALSCALLVGTVFLNGVTPSTVVNSKSSYPESFRAWIENAAHVNAVPQYSSYAILLEEDDIGYSFWLMRYIFQSSNIYNSVIDESSDLSALDNYNYVFVYDKGNDVINNWISEKYPTQAGQDVIICS